LTVGGARRLAQHVKGRTLESITADMRTFFRSLTQDPQLRWLGPEKGIIHMATGAIVNAVWDLWAKREGKPVWKLLVDMPPEQMVEVVDFSYITGAMTADEALEILRRQARTRSARAADVRRDGY